MKKSLRDIAKAIGDAERAHEKQRLDAEEQARQEANEENEIRVAFDAWKPQIATLANKVLESICEELQKNGVDAAFRAYPIPTINAPMAREEFAQQAITWLCWVDVSQTITPSNQHKVKNRLLGQKRMTTRIGLVIPNGVWRVLPLARRHRGEYGQYGAPLFHQDPLPTADDMRRLLEPMFIAALDD